MGQDDAYWERFWSASGLTSNDLFELILPEDVRILRDKASGNLTTLCFKVKYKPFYHHQVSFISPHLLAGTEAITGYIHWLQ